MVLARQSVVGRRASATASWQAFTDKFISEVHSLSVVDIEGKTLRLKQISETGDVVDSFRIAK